MAAVLVVDPQRSTVAQPGYPARVVRAGLALHFDLDGPLHAREHAQDLPLGPEGTPLGLLGCHRHEIDQPERPRLAAERGLEHVRVRLVAALDLVLAGRLELDFVLSMLAATPLLQLESSLLEAAGADGDPQRDADQVGVLELAAGPLVPVVEQHFHPAGRQLLVKHFGGALDLGVVGIDHGHQDLEGGARQRPDDAVFVVVLLDGRRYRPADADSVAAHDQGALLSLVVEDGRRHRLRIFGAELEDMADLDPPPALQVSAAARAGVAANRLAQVGESRNGEVPAVVDAGVVSILFVGADDEIGHRRHLVVGDDAQVKPHRSGKPGRRAGNFLNELLCGEFDMVAAEQMAELDGIEFTVAAQEDRHRFAGIGLDDQGLDQPAGGQVEEESDVLDGPAGGGRHRGRRRRRRGRDYKDRRTDEHKFRPREEAPEETHGLEVMPGETLAKYGHIPSEETPEEAVEEGHSETLETSGAPISELSEGVSESSTTAESAEPESFGAVEAGEAAAGETYSEAPPTEPPASGEAPLVASSVPASGPVPPSAAAEIPAVAWEHQKQTFAPASFPPARSEEPAATPAPNPAEDRDSTAERREKESDNQPVPLGGSSATGSINAAAEKGVRESVGEEAGFPEDTEAAATPSEAVEAAEKVEEVGEETKSQADESPADTETGLPEGVVADEAASAEEGSATPAPADERAYTLREPHQRPRFAPHRRRGRRGMGHRARRERHESRPGNHQAMQIAEVLKEGQEILVQIAKEPLGTKGARITSHIALPGRYLVYMPTINHIGVSRKITSEEERLRLRNTILENKGSLTGGFIVRTAAQGRPEEEFKADLKFLATLWNDIRAKSERMKAPALLHRDLDLVQRLLRDTLTPDFKTVRVDNETDYERVLDFVDRCQPSLVGKVRLYTRDTPVFEEFGVQQEIEKGLKPKVWLKSGGYIVINQTEALVAIDVNTGKYVGKTNRLEDTIVKTNIDAVHEIVRQVRLRDLGGIIVIDFIDMDERKNRQKVVQALEEALRSDRAPTKVISFHDFGLVAITRKRVKQSLERTLCEPCDYCTGSGWIKSVATVCNEILSEARKMAKQIEGDGLTLRVNPQVARALKSRDGRLVSELETMTKKDVIIKSDPTVHQERFEIF